MIRGKRLVRATPPDKFSIMPDTSAIRISGDCTVRSVWTIYREIEAALKTKADISVHCADVEHADITLVQLIVAASKIAERQAKLLELVDPSDVVRKTFVRAGLPAHPCLAKPS